MTNQQLYLALGIPVFGIFMSMLTTILVVVWQAKGIEKRIDGIDKRLDRIDARLEKIETALEMLTGALHELDKRVSIIEDRIFNRGGD